LRQHSVGPAAIGQVDGRKGAVLELRLLQHGSPW
jgi:hypothetical protein